MVIDNPVSTSRRNYTAPQTLTTNKHANTVAERKSSGLSRQDIVIIVEKVNTSMCDHKREADKVTRIKIKVRQHCVTR